MVYVNDFESIAHYGSYLLNRKLKQWLTQYSDLVVSIPHDRLEDESSYDLVQQCAVVIINGEGNFHSRNPRKLSQICRLAGHAKKSGRRVALINTVGQDIPLDIDLSVFDFVSARERLSAAAFRLGGFKGELRVAPDGSMLEKVDIQPRKPGRIIVTDCVIRDIADELKALQIVLERAGFEALYVPLKPMRQVGSEKPETQTRRLLRLFASAQLVVSGRFHANCFALIARTPVISVDSNTHKIRGLMADFGLEDYHFDSVKEMEDLLKGGVPHIPLSPVPLSKARSQIHQSLLAALG